MVGDVQTGEGPESKVSREELGDDAENIERDVPILKNAKKMSGSLDSKVWAELTGVCSDGMLRAASDSSAFPPVLLALPFLFRGLRFEIPWVGRLNGPDCCCWLTNRSIGLGVLAECGIEAMIPARLTRRDWPRKYA